MTNPEPAATALAVPPDLPAGSVPSAAPPTQPAADQVERDRDGAAWDPAVHENPPRRNEKGRWARLRGNAQRRAKGLPMAGIAALAIAKRAESRPDPAAPPAEPPKAVDPPPAASQAPPASILAGEATPIRDGVPDAGPAPGARPVEDYAGTAAGLVDGAFGAAQLSLGPAWLLKTDERRSLVDATQRVLHHYQVPVLGPLLELALVLIPVIGRRRNDPETRRVFGLVLDWWRNRGREKPAADPYRVQPAPASSAPAEPASAVPAAYRDQPAPAPGPRPKVAWIP